MGYASHASRLLRRCYRGHQLGSTRRGVTSRLLTYKANTWASWAGEKPAHTLGETRLLTLGYHARVRWLYDFSGRLLPVPSSVSTEAHGAQRVHSARMSHSDSEHPPQSSHEEGASDTLPAELLEREISRILKRKLKLKETPSDAQTLLVIQPDFKSVHIPAEQHHSLAGQKLEEAISLAEAVTDWKVVEQRIDAVRKVHRRFLFGTGKTAELERVVKEMPITGVFINTLTLSPLQHKFLEELFEKDVFDRFSIVLRIFKERAKTREARVQVELAEIPYLRTHLAEEDKEGGLDQQRGGTGKMGGGGETVLAAARRSLSKKEKALKEELKHIRVKHKMALVQRAKHSLPIVAVVGYTNAGKTTVVRALSGDRNMQPEDMLFATLDSTLHATKLPCGLKVLLVDTIGFISDLPHELVESFSSTLEDVKTAVSGCYLLSHLYTVGSNIYVGGRSHPTTERGDIIMHVLEGIVDLNCYNL